MESMPWIVLMSLLQMLLLDCLYFFSSNELIFMLCNYLLAYGGIFLSLITKHS